MKVVKLNRRYKAFKELGHTVALRFKSYGHGANDVEKICYDRFGGRWHNAAAWSANFGSPDYKNHNGGMRPYWITFKNEADLTLLLLLLDK